MMSEDSGNVFCSTLNVCKCFFVFSHFRNLASDAC